MFQSIFDVFDLLALILRHSEVFKVCAWYSRGIQKYSNVSKRIEKYPKVLRTCFLYQFAHLTQVPSRTSSSRAETRRRMATAADSAQEDGGEQPGETRTPAR